MTLIVDTNLHFRPENICSIDKIASIDTHTFIVINYSSDTSTYFMVQDSLKFQFILNVVQFEMKGKSSLFINVCVNNV